MHISPPLVIGILSDTHGYFHPNLLHYLKDVDLILHAGDVGGSEILDGLSTVTEVRAVWGNIDGWDLRREHPEHNKFEFGGVRFLDDPYCWTTWKMATWHRERIRKRPSRRIYLRPQPYSLYRKGREVE